MSDKKDPAECGAPVEIDNWITERIERADGAICPCDSCLEFYEEIALKAINWCRENEVRGAFEAGRIEKRKSVNYDIRAGGIYVAYIIYKYETFDDYLKAKERVE